MSNPTIFAVSQAFKGNPLPTCALTMNTVAPSSMVRAVSAAACYAAVEEAEVSAESPPQTRLCGGGNLTLVRLEIGGGVQDTLPPHDRICEPRSKDGGFGCGCMAVITNACVGGGGICGSIHAAALCAVSSISGDVGVSRDVAVDSY